MVTGLSECAGARAETVPIPMPSPENNPPSENKPSRAQADGANRRPRSGAGPDRRQREAGPKVEFKTFDRVGMPEPKSMKDPSMRGRMKRSMENRRRKRRRKLILQGAGASLLAIVILGLVGMTVRNYALRSDEARSQPVPGENAKAAKPEPVEPPIEKPPRGSPRVRDIESRQIEEARDRFLVREPLPQGGPLEGSGVTSAPLSTSPKASPEITDEEKERMLRRALPYSTRTREKMETREISPDDLYIPKPGS